MRSLIDIQCELDELTAQRKQLWEELADGRDVTKTSQVEELSRRLEELWNEQRVTKAYLRFGDPKKIIARARAEERFDREERKLRRVAA